ncbi:autophagy protein 5 [Tulasnella sp. 419]|nr:autophagy protein 5 [Tulasnella sp. 418]KAG8970055.1 autophagy protein 5 [Tulasnella sp. 419]
MSFHHSTIHSSSVAGQTPAATSLFRRLVWEGTVPLEIRIDGKELPAGSDRGLECYYIQAPRISYLPLLIPDIKKHLADLVLDEAAASHIKDEDWWFEETERGALMKWHLPIGLLYDLNTVSASLHTAPPPSGVAQSPPLRLTLHLVSPPLDKLLLTPSAESCKQSYMGQLKEADFLRWGNTKRVTSLRKQDHDGLWEGVREHNFDEFWRIASKIFPTTTPLSPNQVSSPNGTSTLNSLPSSPPPSQHLTATSTFAPSRPPSADPSGTSGGDRDGAYNVRSVPVRIYLPDGPVLQELVPPLIEEGRPHTLRHFLRTHLPLLFPPPPSSAQAFAIIHGVAAPGDAEMAWLGACMTGADGWVNICIGLGRPSR